MVNLDKNEVNNLILAVGVEIFAQQALQSIKNIRAAGLDTPDGIGIKTSKTFYDWLMFNYLPLGVRSFIITEESVKGFINALTHDLVDINFAENLKAKQSFWAKYEVDD